MNKDEQNDGPDNNFFQINHSLHINKIIKEDEICKYIDYIEIRIGGSTFDKIHGSNILTCLDSCDEKIIYDHDEDITIVPLCFMSVLDNGIPFMLLSYHDVIIDIKYVDKQKCQFNIHAMNIMNHNAQISANEFNDFLITRHFFVTQDKDSEQKKPQCIKHKINSDGLLHTLCISGLDLEKLQNIYFVLNGTMIKNYEKHDIVLTKNGSMLLMQKNNELIDLLCNEFVVCVNADEDIKNHEVYIHCEEYNIMRCFGGMAGIAIKF
jgi:hypothetical protein